MTPFPKLSSGGPDEPLPRFLLRSLIFVAIVLAACVVVVLLGMSAVNTQLGLDELPETDETQSADLALSDSLWVPDITAVPETEDLPLEGPEAGWPVTPCSLYVTGDSGALHDSLPEARTTEGIPYETLLMVRRWAEVSEMPGSDIDRIYVFNHLDSLYVDLPVALDVGGLKRTIEGRFICYTRLYPLVGGNIITGYEDGISISGVRGVFSRP